MFPVTHKTVIVLDRCPYFLESSQQPVEFDMLVKSKVAGVIPLVPITKSLWTCNVEAVLEYVRVVYDLFPSNKLIQLIASDTDAHVVNSWSPEQQSLLAIMNSLACLPPAAVSAGKSYSVVHGLNGAVEALRRPTHLQNQNRTALIADEPQHVSNHGRIICLTTLKSDRSVLGVEEYVMDAVTEHNKLAATVDTLLRIDHCELVLVDVTPVGKASAVTQRRPKTQLSSVLSCEVHSSQSGRHIAAKLMELVMNNFSLSSTTVTGIPMKEEQNASSSANYDVELLHLSEAHGDMLKSRQAEGVLMPSKEGLYTNTVMLKWCTPKSTTVELQQCSGAYRITPVDVNSRPSSCLTNFLLTGRSVMLEQPRRASSRVISHMLTSHGGEIYIHALVTSRSILEDPPSISEGAGGRLTDYRINDFGEFMKVNRLAPVLDQLQSASSSKQPVDGAKSRLERMTRHWPMVLSDTIIFNMTSVIHPLPSLIVKEILSDSEVLECKKAIYRVVGMETRNESLPMPASGTRGRSGKREEQYRQMWGEFERFIRSHSDTSSMHQKVLECLVECKKLPSDSAKASSSSELQDQTDKETDRHEPKVEIKQEVIESPPEPPNKKYRWFFPSSKHSEPKSLLTMWTNRLSAIHRDRCREFSGRLEAGPGNKAELYQHMKEDGSTASASVH